MSTVEQIEQAISALSREELAELRNWFEQYAEQAWDDEIERDVKAGRLDHLIEEALAEHRDGRTRPL